MDSTVLVALGTVAITSVVTLVSKWIDSKQKINEHKLSVRSIYVNKKIQAAEELVNILHQRKIVFIEYYHFYKYYNDTGFIHLDRAKRCKDKTLELSVLLAKPNHFSVYFDYRGNAAEINKLENIINKNIQIINKAADLSEAVDDNKKILIDRELDILKSQLREVEIENIIKVVPKTNQLYNLEVEKIKAELAKYDIL